MTLNILNVSPHPDDELIISPATLFALRDEGHNIVNLACSLGKKSQKKRREKELIEASKRAGFDLIIPDQMPRKKHFKEDVEALLSCYVDGFDIIASSSNHDSHPTHEATGRAVRDFIKKENLDIPWWQGSLWSDLSFPSIFFGFDSKMLNGIIYALSAHKGEISRNDYRRLVLGRSQANSILGPEKVFGFGSKGIDFPFAEMVSEVRFSSGRWLLSSPRMLDPKNPLKKEKSKEKDLTYLIDSPSYRDIIG